MIVEKSQKEILDSMLKKVNEEYDITEGSLFYDTLAPVAFEFEDIRKTLNYIFLNSFAETAKGEYLDNIAKEVGVFRRQPTKAKGEVKIKGVPGTIVPLNTKVASDTLIFITTEKKEVGTNGEVIVPIEAEKAGELYNLNKATIVNFPVTIPNFHEVKNLTETTDGYDGESDEELRERYYFKVREPVTSGNVYHYKKWTMEVEGVGGVKVFPLWNGNGTVKVVIVNSDIQNADAELIKRTYDYLEKVRPIGATVTVVSATNKEISIEGTVKISSNANFIEIKKEFENKVAEYFKKVGFKQDYVSYAQIGNILLNILGVQDYKELKLNNNVLNILLEDEEIPKLVNINLIEEVAQ